MPRALLPERDHMAEEVDETVDEAVEDAGERRLSGAAATSALKKEREQRKALERQLKSLEAREREREDAEKTETQRLREQLERITSEASEREQRYATEREGRERADRVRRAAKDFLDADEVVAFLRGSDQLDGVDSDQDAERLLKSLAKDKPHLLRKQQDEQSLFDRVLRNGEQPNPSGNAQENGDGIIPLDEYVNFNAEQLAALKLNDYKLYERTVTALAGRDPRTGQRVPIHR